MFAVRLSHLLCSVLVWSNYFSFAKILDELEYSAQELNTTDPDEVETFIKEWTVPHRLKDAQFPALASILPVADSKSLNRRQSPYSCTWSNGNGCSGQGALCCGPINDGWCCAAGNTCCQGGGGGCCGGDGFCCGSQTGRDSGNCCKQGQQCCKGGTGKPFCCDSDQTCDNTNKRCTNPTVTVTGTTTVWVTQTSRQTVTGEGTTTQATVSTRITTIYVTVSTDSITPDLGTATGTLRAGKRFATDFPAPTQVAEHLEVRRGDDGGSDKEASPRAFNIRPVPSLNALANALARRGVAIERRATSTITQFVTVTATTTLTDTFTSTDWTTKWTTSVEVVTQTINVMINSQGGATITVVSGATGTVASSSEEGSTSNGTSKGTIIGAAVGGAAGFIILLILIWFLWRRNKRLKQVNALPPVQHTGGNTQPPMAESQATKPPYAAAGIGGYGVQEMRHDHPGGYGTPVPPAYSSPTELSSTPYTRHSALSSSPPPGGYAYEMPATHQQSPPQELHGSNHIGGYNAPDAGAQRH